VDSHALIDRVAGIKKDLTFCATDPRNRVTIQSVPASTLDQLAHTPDFPPDMLLVLRVIGELLDWVSPAAPQWNGGRRAISISHTRSKDAFTMCEKQTL
jgi:hypothetical protein